MHQRRVPTCTTPDGASFSGGAPACAAGAGAGAGGGVAVVAGGGVVAVAVAGTGDAVEASNAGWSSGASISWERLEGTRPASMTCGGVLTESVGIISTKQQSQLEARLELACWQWRVPGSMVFEGDNGNGAVGRAPA